MSATKKTAADYVVRTRDYKVDQGWRFTHPLNLNSAISMFPLSDRVGMQRAQLTLGRIAPGKESFLPHAHASQEEFVFILEGEAEMEIDGERIAVGPGDYIGFPVDGAVHQLYNTGTRELVYLMGGERTAVEVSFFPTAGKVGYWANGAMRYVDASAGESYRPEDFINRRS